MTCQVLIVVEDPGAANYVAPLSAQLEKSGVAVRLVAAGPAAAYLHERHIPAEQLQLGMTAARLFAQHEPELLIVGTSENPDALGLSLVDEAAALRVPSVAAIDGSANSAFRLRGRGTDALAHRPDWLMVPDQWTKQSYVELGYDPRRIAVCGHPHYDVVRATKAALEAEGREVVRRRVLPDAGDRPAAIFLSELSVGLNAQQFLRSPDYTLRGHGSEQRTLVVLDEFLDAVALLPTRPYLVLRVHPKDDPAGYSERLPAFDLVSHRGNPLELVFASDLVVGMTSMLLLEAALLERPTLSIVPRAIEREWLPSVAWGVTPCVYDSESIRSALRSLLPPERSTPRGPSSGLPPASSTEVAARFVLSRLTAGC